MLVCRYYRAQIICYAVKQHTAAITDINLKNPSVCVVLEYFYDSTLQEGCFADGRTAHHNGGGAFHFGRYGFMCIADPKGEKWEQKENFLGDLFATHPPIEKRIVTLKMMAYTQGSH